MRKDLEIEVKGNPLHNLINRNLPKEFQMNPYSGTEHILLGTKDCPLNQDEYGGFKASLEKQAHLSQWDCNYWGQFPNFAYGLKISSNYFFDRANPKFENEKVTFPITRYNLEFLRGFSKIFNPAKEYTNTANILGFSLKFDSNLKITCIDEPGDNLYKSNWYVKRKIDLNDINYSIKSRFSEKGLIDDVKKHMEIIIKNNEKNYSLVEKILSLLKQNSKKDELNFTDEHFRNFLKFMQSYEIKEIPKKIIKEMRGRYSK